MLGLPEGWESDYGGSRWFYRYKPTGLTQFQFPKPGDEFPQFFDSGFGPLDVAPEERLAIERQAKRRSDCDGDNYPENNSRTGDTGRSKVPTLEEKEPMSATGYFDTGSYMYFGPGTYNDVSPVADDGDTAYMVSGKRAKEAMRNLAADISPEPTPPVTHIQPVTTESVPGHSFTSESVELVAPEFTTSASQRKPDVYELHEGGGQMWSPLGFIAELASSDTVKCAEELTPIELDATSMTIASTRTKAAQDDPVELPTLGSPVERQPTTPKSTSPPLQHVEPNPLCSASFAQPPLKPKIDHTRNISPTTSGMVQEQNARASEGPVSDSTGHTKYQPWTPAQSPDVQDSKQSSRISMAPSKMSVLQSQDSELGIISGVDASLNPGQGVPDALAPPSGPRLINANVTPPQQTESSTDLTVGSGLSQGPSVSQPGAHQQDDSDSKCSQAAFGGPPQQVANNLSPPLPPRPVAKHMTSTGTSGMDQEQSLAQTYLAQGQQFAQTLGGQPYTLQAALHGKPFNSAQASAAITDAGKGMKKWAKRVWQNPAMKQTTAAIGGAIFAESMGGDGAAGAALANQIFNTSQARPQGGQLQPQRPPGPPHAQTAPAQVPANPVSVQQQQQQIQAAQSMHQQQTGMPIGVQTPGRPPVVQNPAIAGMTVNMNAQMQQGGSNRPPQPMARPPVGRPPPPQMVQQSFASQQPGFQVQGQVLMDPTVAASASLVSAAFGVARRDERQQSNHTQPQPQPQTNPQAQPEQHEPPSETNAAADHSTSDYFFAPETTIYVKNTTAVADTTYVDAAYIGTTYVDTVQADTTQDEATYEDTTYMDTACGDIIHVDTTCVDTTYADSTYVDTTYVDVNYNETVYTEETVSMVSVDESMSYAGGSEWAVSTIDTDYSGGDWGDCGDLI
ncbi:Uu.00g083910.m01.CDS01 [Anthostomella pinea]|uniref:Uu.00g083910.m01.CDS01 n=1 Tax=Anthostomella pinea TaxID=933095 RepID=A0AAI8VLM9_9PEZI|nr:Uu.00g083910.m01.CDS01 [Anthostomella pinea]